MLDFKEKRRKNLERKKKDKLKRNPVAKDLSKHKYRQRIVEEKKEKGGAKNINQLLDDVES